MNQDGHNNDTSMLAFVVHAGGGGSVQRTPRPQLSLDTTQSPASPLALIRVLRAGVCNTDLEILQGYMGFQGVLGHEFVGIVEQVSIQSEEQEWIGKRVCGDINVGCATCHVCTNAFHLDQTCNHMSRNHCPNRTVLGILNHAGTMAEYLTLPLTNLHVVPDHVSDQVAAFAEPLAAACRIVEQDLIYYGSGHSNGSQDRPDRVAILGDGKLGLMIAEVLGREYAKRRLTTTMNTKTMDDFRPVLFGKHAHKLELVQESGVVGKFVSECQDDAAFGGVAAEHANQYDVVVDATGSPAGLSLASGLCRPMGKVVLKSTCAAGEKFNAAPFVIDELQVVGSRCGPIDTALQLLAMSDEAAPDSDTKNASQKPLRVEKYITQTFPLSKADDAIQCAAEKSTMKVQIICSDS